MKYVLMAYSDTQWLARMSNHERARLAQAAQANNEALRASGHLLATEQLYSPHNTTTIRVYPDKAHDKGHDKVSVINGALAATQEQLMGIYVIAARDLNEAIQVAAQMPQAINGPIEVRPLLDLDPDQAHPEAVHQGSG